MGGEGLTLGAGIVGHGGFFGIIATDTLGVGRAVWLEYRYTAHSK